VTEKPGRSVVPAFSKSAAFYDAIYAEKDYAAECAFFRRMFELHGRVKVRSVLDLGCGTGRHAVEFAKMGYNVLGVDLSEDMLAIARKRAVKGARFKRGDVRRFRSGRKFDAAVAAFAVMSYQNTNADVAAALESARRCLRKGGVFAFDFWFGPAVLAVRPGKRSKVFKAGKRTVIREALPRLDPLNQCVEVRYSFKMSLKNRIVELFEEIHRVRFFFPQEIAYFLERAGFDLVLLSAFPGGSPPAETDWNAAAVARAR